MNKFTEDDIFFVLDDVWNENLDKWFSLKDLLSKGGKRVE